MSKHDEILGPMGPDEFRAAQQTLGLSDGETAELLGHKDRVTVRRYKMGPEASQRRPVMQPVALLMRILVRVPEARRLLGLDKRKGGT